MIDHNFWDSLDDVHGRPALKWKGGQITYSELEIAVAGLCGRLLSALGGRALGFILCRSQPDVVKLYLASLRAKCPALLLSEDISEEQLARLSDIYLPSWVATSPKRALSGYRTRFSIGSNLELKCRNLDVRPEVHNAVALLLSTSGTTGSAKLVKLSARNLASNAASIAIYLRINSDDTAITTLPMNYSYGLSVLNSHLCARACILLTDDSILTNGFWQAAGDHKITTFAGVPYTYQMLMRLNRLEGSSIRSFTQAGGRLADSHLEYFLHLAQSCAKEFVVMYGQTEASPRISYVPYESLASKIGSIGIAIPGGTLSLDIANNEVLYEGPNVMLGYANGWGDLAKGDELSGKLRTGDLGAVDADGFYYIRGRIGRFLKIFGNRVNLDEVEVSLERKLGTPISVTGVDDKMIVVYEGTESSKELQIKNLLISTCKMHHSAIEIRSVETLPRLESGKTNYAKLLEML